MLSNVEQLSVAECSVSGVRCSVFGVSGRQRLSLPSRHCIGPVRHELDHQGGIGRARDRLALSTISRRVPSHKYGSAGRACGRGETRLCGSGVQSEPFTIVRGPFPAVFS